MFEACEFVEMFLENVDIDEGKSWMHKNHREPMFTKWNIVRIVGIYFLGLLSSELYFLNYLFMEISISEVTYYVNYSFIRETAKPN